MENQSILFQSISGEKETASAVRKAFRVPVPDSVSVQVLLGKKECSLLNISHGGISVICEDALDVECDGARAGWELKLGKIRLHNLTGKVIHCSSMASGQWLYGIEWLDLGEDEIAAITEAVSQLKAMAFGDNDRNIPPAQAVEK
jgi:c-di-GMP-binding flagellar brake protein YcgR